MKNGYIVACPETRHAIYIDPGDEAPQLLEWLAQKELELKAVFNTHGHLDHVCGNRTVKERYDVPIFLHQEDEFIYEALSDQAAWFGLNYPPGPPVDRYFTDRERLPVGNLHFCVHHTPGHSPGSVTLEVEDLLFCGDLIFAGAVGRTDLPGGSHPQLIQSIRERILPLGDGKQLLPGHGAATTVGVEAETNPFLK